MSTVRPGNQPALVVVDVQVGVMADAWEASRLIEKVARTVERAREQGVPVIWVQHEDEELVRDSAAWQLVPQLIPAPGEARIGKKFNSADTTPGIELADGSKIEAAGIVKDLNIAMTWASYPGRKNGTAAAEDVDFAAPGAKH